MTRRAELGKRGEEMAADWLTSHGFSILCRNWRDGRYEIDLIAGRECILHFIEVKTRRSGAYGYPEESVNRKKLEHILQAASGWLHRWPAYTRIQYDVLAITLKKNTLPEFMLFGDVYL
jgi:putative endonuclease